MKKAIFTGTIILTTLALTFAFAQGSRSKDGRAKMRLAVIDFTPKGTSKIMSGAVTDLVRSELIDTGLFTVVERGEMKEILKEQEFGLSGCTDQACAVQMGKLLSANKMLLGDVTAMGRGFLITARLVDVEKGVSDFSASERAESDQTLDRAATALTKTMVERIMGVRGAKITIEKETRLGYYSRALVPGWGQLYMGEEKKGYYFLGGFAASTVATLGSFQYYRTKQKAYRDLPPTASQDTFNMRYDEYRTAGNIFYWMAGIFTLVYVANWVDILFYTAPPSPHAGGIPFNGGSFALYMRGEEHPEINGNVVNYGLSYTLRY